MDVKEALRRLEEAGTEQNRKVYARHGVRPPAFGVSYANLARLQKSIGRDTVLARELWTSGNHDARVLATKVAEAGELSTRELRAWARELRNYVLTDALAALAAAHPEAPALARSWIAQRGEWPTAAGWNVVCALAMRDGVEPADAELAKLLGRIRRDLRTSPNRTRYAMNGALIAIGSRGGELAERALEVARRLGPVEVDHGETGCRTPDAESYIEKAAAHRAKRRKKA